MPKFDINSYTPKETYYSLGELGEDILLLEDNEPNKKDKKDYKLWVELINDLFIRYNEKADEKIFKIIK